jgi:TonB-linked SusC/RagA family outer membrane protein
MKLTIPMLIIALIHLSATGYSQITLKEKNAPPEKVLAAIEKQTKYVFLYDPDDLKNLSITIDVKNATLQETLEKCFKGLPIEFTLVGNNVLLKKKRPENEGKAMIADQTIQGRIVEENGQSLPGVTIYNTREMKGTQTDTSGAFSISGAKGDNLRFSFVGYKEKEIRVGEQRYLNITLEVNPSSPDQVVVIGYGSSKKRDLTGSISTVDMKNRDEIPFNTVDNSLAGQAAGVQVTKTDGTPGGMVRIRVRGSSSLLGGSDPLYVIDGIPVQVRSNFIDPGFAIASPAANLSGDNGTYGNGAALSASFVNGLNTLGVLNPDDIESISILKDASSSAIYGSKAANGVVLITTRSGKTNTHPQVATSYYSTLTSPYKLPRLLNASQYKTLLTEAAQNASEVYAARGFSPDDVTTGVLGDPNFFGTANTNWIKAVTRTTFSDNAGVSVSGGGQESKYFTSIAYNNTQGVVDATGYQRISGKINLETKVGSKFSFATNLLLGFTNQDLGDGAYAQALLARPDMTPRDNAGNYTAITNGDHQGRGFLSPVALLTATNNGKTSSFLGSVSGVYSILKNLSFRSTVSLNKEDYNQRNFLPAYININVDFINTPNPGGIGSAANSRFADWFLENTLSYNKQFNRRNAGNIIIGQSYETTKYSYFRTTGAGYPNSSSLTSLSLADTILSSAGDEPVSPQSYLLSFYARANYSYEDKYLFTFTGRTDGSSKFGPNNKFGYFPSGAVAWRMSRENFLKGVRWVSDIKLRGSYGLTGNQNIGDQMYRTVYSSVSYAGGNALIPTQLGNEGIKWEGTRETDIGLDMAFFAGRLYGTVDYYHKQTSDALLSVPLPSSSTYSTLLQNSVGLRSKGIEINIGGDLIRTRDFRWAASINATWNKSLVTKLDPRAGLSQIVSPTGLENVGSHVTRQPGNTTLVEGKPLGSIPGYVMTGVIKTQAQLDAYNKQQGSIVQYLIPLQLGDAMYRLDTSLAPYGYEIAEGNVIISDGIPKYFGGMTQELSYKKLGLLCNFTFAFGGHLVWAEHAASTQFFGAANADELMLNRYTPANTNSNQPRLSLASVANWPNSSDVFNSSYVKLRSLTLNYHFDQVSWMKRASIKNIRIFVSATNVFTITKYPGSDPETSDDPYSVNGGFIDVGNYPATRTFSLGLKAVFQ